MTLSIDPEFKKLIPPLSADEYAQLEANLKAEGCRDALVAWKHGDELTLIDGHNRHEICTKHSLPFQVVEREFEDRNDVLVWMVTNQLARRNLTVAARGELAIQMKKAIAAKAKLRLATSTGGASPQPLSNLTKAEPVNTRKALAEIAETSTGTMRKIEHIFEKAPKAVQEKARTGVLNVDRAFNLAKALEKASPEVAEAALEHDIEDPAMVAFLEEKKSTETVQSLFSSGVLQPGDESEAKPIAEVTLLDLERELKAREKEHRRTAQDAKREAVMKSIQSFPTDVFSVIYADPPWQYSNSGWAGSAESHYPTMHIDDICALGNKIKTSENAALLLWATNPLLPEAFKVMKAWGFEYKSNMVWVKDKSVYGPLPQYVYGRHELLLIAVKGSFRPITMLDSVLEQAKGRHSEKPRMYASIETMYPDQHYLELFAREVEARTNWTFWGGEVEYASAA